MPCMVRWLKEHLGSSWRASVRAERERPVARPRGDAGFGLLEMVVTLLIVSIVVPVVYGIIDNLNQSAQNIHAEMASLEQDQSAGNTIVQYLHSAFAIGASSTGQALSATLEEGYSDASATDGVAQLNAVYQAPAASGNAGTLTVELGPFGGSLTSKDTYYVEPPASSSAIFQYGYTSSSASGPSVAFTANPTANQLASVVAVEVSATFVPGLNLNTNSLAATRPSTLQSTVYLQNASGTPQPSTSTTVAASTTPTVGAPVTLTAAVLPIPDTGAVAFSVNDPSGALVPCIAGSLVAGATTCTFTPGTWGAYTVSAEYSGDESFEASTSPALTVAVAYATTTTLSLGAPPLVGASDTVTASVASPGGGPTPTAGSVAFTVGQGSGTLATACQSVTVDSFGHATCTFTPTSNATLTFNATYTGPAEFYASTAAPITAVAFVSTGTTVSASSSPTVGSAVTLTATVAPSPSGGSVGFTVTSPSGAAVACTAGTLTSGRSTCQFTPTVSGAYSALATYSGNSAYGPSTSPTTAVSAAYATATSVSLGSAPLVGTQDTVTATVVASGSGAAPTGTLSVSGILGGNAVSTSCTALVGGSETCSFTPSTTGTITFNASYPGATGFSSSSATPATATVTNLKATTTSVSTLSTPTVGSPTNLTATVITPTNGSPNGGSVTFAVTSPSGSAVTCTAGTLVSGQSSCTFTPSTWGSYTVVATYSGNGTYATSTASAYTLDVLYATMTTLAVSPSSPTHGQLLTVTARVTASSGGSTPTGVMNVSATFGGNPVSLTCTSLSAGSETCTYSPRTSGTFVASATYLGSGGSQFYASPTVNLTKSVT